MARLIIKRIQAIRKDSGFEITDRIKVTLEHNEMLENAVNVFGEHISSQVLANELVFGDATDGIETEFGDFKTKVKVEKN